MFVFWNLKNGVKWTNIAPETLGLFEDELPFGETGANC